MKLVTRSVVYEFPARPLVMGIINLVADSFSRDGLEDIDSALDRARAQIVEGAEIIDIGAESARTNRPAMPEDQEIAQLLRFIERWPEIVAATRGSGVASPILSINTWRPEVIRAVLPHGGDLLNDLSGLPTDENARLCAEHGVALLIMHSVGEPKTAHTHVTYGDVIAALDEFFTSKIVLAEQAGVPRDAIILDPGIDFAKQRRDNLRILRELSRLKKFERPILLPVSRKTVIGEVLGVPDPVARDAGTVACIVQGMLAGANIFRVHNVRAAMQAIRMIAAVEGSG